MCVFTDFSLFPPSEYKHHSPPGMDHLSMMLSIFSCAYLPFVHIEMSVHILCSFSKLSCVLLLGCKNSLYILDISPLSDIWFANIFSHPMC